MQVRRHRSAEMELPLWGLACFKPRHSSFHARDKGRAKKWDVGAASCYEYFARNNKELLRSLPQKLLLIPEAVPEWGFVPEGSG
jgi:hypothetical protein